MLLPLPLTPRPYLPSRAILLPRPPPPQTLSTSFLPPSPPPPVVEVFLLLGTYYLCRPAC